GTSDSSRPRWRTQRSGPSPHGPGAKPSRGTINMRRSLLGVVLMMGVLGCESQPKSDEIIPIDQVPAHVIEVARKQLPGYTFDTAYKMKIDGKDAYEVRGKDKRGKVREVEVSATGEVLAIE